MINRQLCDQNAVYDVISSVISLERFWPAANKVHFSRQIIINWCGWQRPIIIESLCSEHCVYASMHHYLEKPSTVAIHTCSHMTNGCCLMVWVSSIYVHHCLCCIALMYDFCALDMVNNDARKIHYWNTCGRHCHVTHLIDEFGIRWVPGCWLKMKFFSNTEEDLLFSDDQRFRPDKTGVAQYLDDTACNANHMAGVSFNQ